MPNTDFLQRISQSLNKPNDFLSRLSSTLQTGIAPQTTTSPFADLELQIKELQTKNIPVEKVHELIDSPDFEYQDKIGAKDFATNLYNSTISKSPTPNTPVISPLVEKGIETIGGAIANRAKSSSETYQKSLIEHGLTIDPLALGTGLTKVSKVPQAFKGFKDLTTSILNRLKGKSITSKQEILDFTNMPELKQAERDLIRNIAGDYPDKIPVQEFANKVKTELLPLKSGEMGDLAYENISLPEYLRGAVANYSERVYESPVKTSAGNVHFNRNSEDWPNYFAHTRIEDLPLHADKKGVTKVHGKGDIRRVIELQSDLFQKGRLEESIDRLPNESIYANLDKSILGQKEKGLQQLEPYRNTWHERIIREEVKQAAKDGKTKLQFPTGETAMKIEGLGILPNWTEKIGSSWQTIEPDSLKVGKEVAQSISRDTWIITDVLGDGKFKATPKSTFEYEFNNQASVIREAKKINRAYVEKWGDKPLSREKFLEMLNKSGGANIETFDISGKIDTSNPIYRFYEKEVGRFLQNKFGAKLITDPQGVKWMEVDVSKSAAKEPVQAYGHINVETAVKTGVGAAVASLIIPLIQGKLADRDQETYYNTFKQAIEQMKLEDFKFIHDNLKLIKDSEKRSELSNILADRNYELMQQKLKQ